MSHQPWGLYRLYIGGLLYTLGVPFNVRDKWFLGIPDHVLRARLEPQTPSGPLGHMDQAPDRRNPTAPAPSRCVRRAQTIWHLFVIGGSMAHYYCVYFDLTTFPYEGLTTK